jgi:hypothetical protein
MLKIILHMFCVQINHVQEKIYTIRVSRFDILSVTSEDYKTTAQLSNYLPIFRTNLIAPFA